MKAVQCYELFGGIAHKNHAFLYFILIAICYQSIHGIFLAGHDVLW